MAGMDRISLLKRALPVVVTTAADGREDLASRGANVIIGMGQQAQRREKTSMAMTAFKAATRAGGEIAEVAEGAGSRIGVGMVARLGVGAASRYGVLAVPVAGEVAGGAMLAYDVWKLGFKAGTGRDFETTSVGKAVTRGSNGIWHAGLGAAGGMMSVLGMKRAAEFTRGWLSEAVTGSRAWGAGPGPSAGAPAHAEARETAAAARPDAARKAVQAPMGHEAKDRGGHRGEPTTRLVEGPSRPMGPADWKETPYAVKGASVSVSTTPLGRAFATMDMLVADVGLPSGATAPEAAVAKPAARAVARQGGMG